MSQASETPSLLAQLSPRRIFDGGAPRVAVVRLSGVLAAEGRNALNLASVARPLEKAFAGKPAAVALQLNSPGGSPVQSNLIATRIRSLAEQHAVPVYAFCEDVAASGGYWIAAAADEIYADAASLVGSIGVISASFGFVGALEKLGVERRVTTAGENKMRLDPFQPSKPADQDWLKALQGELHALFRAHVRARRGDKLSAAGEAAMNGDVFLGAKALELGLIDGLGDLKTVMQGKLGEKVKLRVVRGPRRLGAGLLSLRSGGLLDPDAAAETLKAQLAWSRYGL